MNRRLFQEFFSTKGKELMGLNSQASLGLDTLGTGVMQLTFRSSQTTPTPRLLLTMFKRKLSKHSKFSFINLQLILSKLDLFFWLALVS